MESKYIKNDIAGSVEQVASKNTLSALAFRYLPFWPIFFITIVVSLTIAYFYLHYQTPIYEANSTILLKEQSSGKDNNILEALGISNSGKVVENEIEVLKSRTVAQRLADSMKLYALIYKKGTFRDVLIYPSPVMFVSLNTAQLQKAPGKHINFEYLPAENVILLDGKKYPLGVPVDLPFGRFRLEPSPEYAKLGLTSELQGKYYLQLRSIKAAAASIIGSLTVASTAKQSTLITLKLRDPVPARSEDILNKLIEFYNQAGIEDKNATAASTLKFIENRLQIVTGELSTVESDLQHYRTKEGILDLTEEGKDYLSAIQENNRKEAEMQVQLAVLDQIEQYIVNKGPAPGTVPATLGINDAVLTSLLERLAAAETLLSNLRQTAGENSPGVRAAKAEIAQVKPSLLENVNNMRQALQTSLRRIRQENAKN